MRSSLRGSFAQVIKSGSRGKTGHGDQPQKTSRRPLGHFPEGLPRICAQSFIVPVPVVGGIGRGKGGVGEWCPLVGINRFWPGAIRAHASIPRAGNITGPYCEMGQSEGSLVGLAAPLRWSKTTGFEAD
ncbi:hypothetical protein JZ751_027042 [Albula glossodonta]|uniref:Uncharacterized protein n=1 Tax=Albula glossodonta TaxID=121402 RepID=A0A8T2NCK0_9TELE|nr:hypothetical protein JZ751_027042 [Albula glossodonta]